MLFENILNVIYSNYVSFMIGMAGIILLFFVIVYRRSTKELKAIREILKQSEQEDESIRKVYLIDSELKKIQLNKTTKNAWDSFYSDSNSGKSEILPDPLDYFHENQLVFKIGHRKILDIIPAMFVSLGLLGTFWGIVIGIGEINSNEGSEELLLGINQLLEGMNFAFYSSIAGIVISLLFQLIDRIYLFKMLNDEVDKFLNELATTFPLESEVSFLDKMVKSQESQLNEMRSFFTDEFLPRLTSGISDTVSASLSPHLVKSNEIMEQVSKGTMEAQTESLNEMVNHFVASLNEVTGDHIAKLGEALENTVEWQERVHGEMTELVDALSNVAERQAEMAENTTELSSQMNEHTVTLSEFQEKLVASTSDLKEVTNQNATILKDMGESFVGLDNVIGRISDLSTTMSELQEETKKTTEVLNVATINMNENVENNERLTESLLDQHEVSNEWSVKTHELLEDVAHNANISETIQNNLEKLYTVITDERQSLDAKQDEYNTTISNSIQELNHYWKENRELLLHNEERFSELNNVLSDSMNDFADHMHSGVQNTFKQFDTELKKAVEYLERGVSGIQIVVESMEHDLENVNSQITRFNQTIEKLTNDVEPSGEVNV